MVKMLLVMHHIALCTPCIVQFNVSHLLHIRWTPWSRKQKFKRSKKLQWVFRGPQASNVVDANIFVMKASPAASNHCT
jgi:hypothetical protein